MHGSHRIEAEMFEGSEGEVKVVVETTVYLPEHYKCVCHDSCDDSALLVSAIDCL